MERTEIIKLYDNTVDFKDRTVKICGWIKSVRDSKNVGFIEINDGSCFKGTQVVFGRDRLSNYEEIASLNVGSSIVVTGKLLLTPQAKQEFEINADSIEIAGESSPQYPLQKKRHTLEYLRTIGHLRARTNTYSAIFRVRSCAAFAIHKFFNDNGFFYVHTPIISSTDAEGAGEMFKVTSLDLSDVPKNDNGGVNYKEDFFGRPSYLTVSGQLQGECMAAALGKVYTFGPTFRAEKSYTQRHAAEFWMIEPEMSFANLNDDMDTAESMIKYVLSYVLENNKDEMQFFNDHYDKGLIERLLNVVNSDFERISYTKAIEYLEANNDNFEFRAEWGCDLSTEHEKYLSEQVFQKPVFITDYPKDIKAFYMRLNSDDKTVAAMDLLVAGIGEIIGGSQREERLDILTQRMQELSMNIEDYQWYLDLRRFGTVAHSGFGLGFERLIMYITGISNIRDVALFPKTAGYTQF
ncbi:MAG: asparagine--tRNA ligase [Oscillospiraceae bacterium]|jgi:asparaginyl-tRNA synthetase|nr:asparagine--tRNA ligase [Oscillospiraceae bacterium]